VQNLILLNQVTERVRDRNVTLLRRIVVNPIISH